jgi:hypothetical protein
VVKLLIKTPYHQDFLEYYERAKTLNLRNIGKLPPDTLTGDPLQDNVTIYDTVWRRYAGFSKVLEQLWYGPETWTQRKSAKAYKDILTVEEWLYICLIHRLTGSGASFEKDHGYRNTAVIKMVEGRRSIKNYSIFLREYQKPMFTSIGNQIPPFNKPTRAPYSKGGVEFLCVHAPKLVSHMADVITSPSNQGPMGIMAAVDECLNWMTANGFKKYHFVLTAWVMDMAEYYPEYVDPSSDVYIGKNCARSLDLMYVKPDSINKKEFYLKTMRDLCDTLNNHPYNVEDVLCDSVRYWANYIPKNYTQHYESLSKVPRITLN